jgi:hypothetical protein
MLVREGTLAKPVKPERHACIVIFPRATVFAHPADNFFTSSHDTART